MPPSPPAPRPDERRKHKRVKLSMLLRIRNSQGQSEVVQTLDVSKGGALFLSKHRYRAGEILYLTLPSSDKPAPVEARSRIVRVQAAERGTLCAVKFEKA